MREAAMLRRVTALEQKGLYDEAIQTLQKAIALAPGKASHCVRLAELYRAQRKMAPAIEALKRAVELDPSSRTPQEALLLTYVEAGRLDEAIQDAKRMLKGSPRNILALELLGVAYLQKGLLDDALRVQAKLIQIDPTDGANHFKRGVLFQQKGEPARAIEEFTRVLEMDPDGELSDQAREAIAALDGYQLRQIATLAADDALFRTKLLRDPEAAAIERGFVLSFAGRLALRSIDFDSLPDGVGDQQRYYH